MKPSWIQVVEHPLVATKLSILRSKTTAPDEFRRNLQTLAVLLLCEAGQNWEIDTIEVETPLKTAPARFWRSRLFWYDPPCRPWLT
jgi:uracil phosphoribosyltransferase